MTLFDIAVSLGSFAVAGIGIAFVLHVVRTSGRDRPSDPEGVRRFIEITPRYRPDQAAADERWLCPLMTRAHILFGTSLRSAIR